MDFNEKFEIAKHPNTPQETLKLLATDEDPGVRYWLAKNPNIPQETLELLATDKDPYVRRCVTQHPNCNQIIERLVLMTDYKLSTANT